MMNLHELMKHFRFLSALEGYSPEEREFLERFLAQEHLRNRRNGSTFFACRGSSG